MALREAVGRWLFQGGSFVLRRSEHVPVAQLVRVSMMRMPRGQQPHGLVRHVLRTFVTTLIRWND